MPEHRPRTSGRRSEDSGFSGSTSTLAMYLDKILIGAIGLVFMGIGWIINDFGKKVEKLTDKVGIMTEAMVAVTIKQSNNEAEITEIKKTIAKHMDEDRHYRPGSYRPAPKEE